MTYNKAVALLCEAGIENAETDAAILFEHFAGMAKHSLPFRRNEEIESRELMSALERRTAREPLQYILGEWEFFGLRFNLNSDCLCPRPDTELIVELALKNLPPRAHFCDIGTGSGAIAVSTAHYRKDTTAEAFDINENALSAASHNSVINGVSDRVMFTQADALAEDFLDGKRFDAILSNPPTSPPKSSRLSPRRFSLSHTEHSTAEMTDLSSTAQSRKRLRPRSIREASCSTKSASVKHMTWLTSAKKTVSPPKYIPTSQASTARSSYEKFNSGRYL